MFACQVAVGDLPALPRDEEGPVFKEPWEAHAFALAVRLSEAGAFSWSEWAAVLGQEIRAAQARGDPDLGQTYYQHWLGALERLCQAKGLVSGAAMTERKEQWRRAYLHTPHGRPVELAVGVHREEGGELGTDAMPKPATGLMLDFLGWVAGRRRTYAEAMDAWRSTCPRHTVWEDALAERLIQVEAGATPGQSEVKLTPRGQAVLDRGPCHDP